MGCKQSSATKSAKSIETNDTYIDDYDETVTNNQRDLHLHVPESELKEKDTMNSFIRNNNSKTAFGNSSYNNHNSVSNGYNSKGRQNITRQPLTIIPSAQPVYKQRKPKPEPSNTKNITDLVDLEEYGLPGDDSDKPNSNIVVGGYAIDHSKTGISSDKNDDNKNQKSITSGQKVSNSSTFSTPKVPKTSRSTVSPKTESITQIVDLEDFDSSHVDNSLGNMSIKSDDKRIQNSQITNGHAISKTTDISKQNKVQPITILSGDKSSYGAQRTRKSASSHTENITQVVDLEEYDL